MSRPAKRHLKRLGAEPLAVANGALGREHVVRDPALHHGALRFREGVQHVTAGAGECAHVARLRSGAGGPGGFPRG